MRLVLDTHALIWLMTGSRPLRPPTLEAIEEARETDEVFVPVICFWEVGMLHAKRRIELDKPPLAWAQDVLRQPGVNVANLTFSAAIASTDLPEAPNCGPADHMVVATARELDATLVTHDKTILRYAAEGHLKALAA